MKNVIKTVLIVCALVYLFHGYGYGAQAIQNIDIKNGFNFISFTITPEFTPQTLISLYPDIENIYQYNSASGSFVSYGDGNLTSLATGKGYIVKSKAALTLSVSGQQEFSVGNINIKQGFNLVGFSKASAGVKFSSLLAVSAELKGIYKWSPSSGMFLQVVKNIIGTPEIFDGGPVLFYLRGPGHLYQLRFGRYKRGQFFRRVRRKHSGGSFERCRRNRHIDRNRRNRR